MIYHILTGVSWIIFAGAGIGSVWLLCDTVAEFVEGLRD